MTTPAKPWPAMTRADWEARAKSLWEELNVGDPVRAEQLALQHTGAKVWAWSRLTTREVRAFSASLFFACFMVRGGP